MDEEEIQMTDKDLVWVHPNFKRMLKKKAADEGKSMIKMTEEMSNRITPHKVEERRKKSAFQRFKL